MKLTIPLLLFMVMGMLWGWGGAVGVDVGVGEASWECLEGETKSGDELPPSRVHCSVPNCCVRLLDFRGAGAYSATFSCGAPNDALGCSDTVGSCRGSHMGRVSRCVCRGHRCNAFGLRLPPDTAAPVPTTTTFLASNPFPSFTHSSLSTTTSAPSESSSPDSTTPNPTTKPAETPVKTESSSTTTQSQSSPPSVSNSPTTMSPLTQIPTPNAEPTTTTAGSGFPAVASMAQKASKVKTLGSGVSTGEVAMLKASTRLCIVGKVAYGSAEPRKTKLCHGSCIYYRGFGFAEESWGCSANLNVIHEAEAHTEYCINTWCTCAQFHKCNRREQLAAFDLDFDLPLPPKTKEAEEAEDATETRTTCEGWLSIYNPFLWAFVVVLLILLIDIIIGAWRARKTYLERP